MTALVFSLAMESAIKNAAAQFRLPEQLVHSVVQVESSGLTGCVRFEPAYSWVWDNAKNSPFRKLADSEVKGIVAPAGFTKPHSITSSVNTEWVAQRISWGPMQLMGATARELGFVGWLPDLCSEHGVEWGARYLSVLRSRYSGHGWRGIAAAYNAGSPRLRPDGTFENQDYLEKLEGAGMDFDLAMTL